MGAILDKVLYNTELYHNYTLEHGVALVVFFLISFMIIKTGKKYNEKKKRKTMLILSLLPLLMLAFRTIMDWQMEGVNLQDDLPLHLCRILSFIAPVIIIWGNSRAKSILYYLALAGVTNAMITADITYSFPHYGYFAYWIYHGSLVLLALFGILVMNSRMTLREGLAAFLSINLYFLVLHFINIALDSNYMYSRAKPNTASLMDHLGPWPVYIIWLEVIALGLILIIYFIFNYHFRTKQTRERD